MQKLEEYNKVPLKSVIPETPLPSDIFVFLGGKYLKYLSKNDQFTAEQFNKFITKRVKCVYIHIEEFDDFMDWLKAKKETVLEKEAQRIGGKLRPLAEASQELRELSFEVFTDEEIDEQKVEKLQDQARQLISVVKKDPKALAALAKISRYNKSIADHSINVANLSVFLGMTLGHSHPLVLENLYLGGLWHDYGKTRFDQKAWKDNNMTTLYSHSLQDHPRMGASILRQTEKFPDQVLTIVMQHHEQFAGGGYPKGLKGKEIYELSRIVAIANIFDNICCEKKVEPEESRIKRALKVLEYDKGKQFDPELIEKIKEAMGIVYEDIIQQKKQDNSEPDHE